MKHVFISYRHESAKHAKDVRRLGELLREARIPVELDQFYLEENAGGPDEGWPKWCEDRANQSICVLIIASSGWFAAYEKSGVRGRGLGAASEADLFRQDLWDEQGYNARIRLAFLHEREADTVPARLKSWQQFRPFASEAELAQLIQWLVKRLELEDVELPTVRWKPSRAKDILESPQPTTLRILFALSCLYWILTGPWPLLWLFVNPGPGPNCHDWWLTTRSSPHLYLHSTCVGLFLTLCLRYPLGAMFASSIFRKSMWRMLPVLLVITLLFILNDVKEGPELYGCDPTGFWLPLSSALQMLAFTLTATVAILIGLRTVGNPSQHIADRKVSNRLFGTILYGLLWLPMRSAYEQTSPNARGLLHSDSFWIVIFIFILGEALLVFSVLYKQRRYVAPIFVTIVSTLVLLLALVYPNVCNHLFGKSGHIYLLLWGLGVVGYVGMIPDERKNKS